MPSVPLNILISPLDWGLGHATRCIPLIRQLGEAGHKVSIAGSGRSLIMLQKEFPHLESIELQSFSPSYSRSGTMTVHLFLLLPQFIGSIFAEHRRLNKLNSRYHFDIVISDNRYGLWNGKVRSILITHQVMIKTPGWLRFAEYPLYLISRMLIGCFDECWIPDHKDSPWLSGDLSHKYKLPGNAKFVGPLSRFSQSDHVAKPLFNKEKITVIISGPEPQRSIFENLVTDQLASSNLSATIISGKPESDTIETVVSNLSVLPHLATARLAAEIQSSALVICRSGYSSIMDLQALGAKALFVPTPGQTEQIYLAQLHQQGGTALWRKQEDLNVKADVTEALLYDGFKAQTNDSGLAAAIAGLRKK